MIERRLWAAVTVMATVLAARASLAQPASPPGSADVGRRRRGRGRLRPVPVPAGRDPRRSHGDPRPPVGHLRQGGHLPRAPLRPAREALPRPGRRGRREDGRDVRPARLSPGARRKAHQHVPHPDRDDRRGRLHGGEPDLREPRGDRGAAGPRRARGRRPRRLPSLPLRGVAGHDPAQPRPPVPRGLLRLGERRLHLRRGHGLLRALPGPRAPRRLRHRDLDPGGRAARLRLPRVPHHAARRG